jgi:phosphoglycerate kinase
VSLPTLDDLLASPEAVRGQRVFVRADLNVPLRERRVADDTRIRASLGTLQRLVGAGARVVVASHLGRPKGERRLEFSLRPVSERLAELLRQPVAFAEDCVDEAAETAVGKLGPGDVLLLENVRFHAGETKNDPDLSKRLASLADVYVNDAFGTAHRAHASTVGMVPHVSRRAAGDLLGTEIEKLRRVLEPKRPFLCLLGGAKVSDKLAVLAAMAERADVIAVGGAMAYTFLAADEIPTGASLVEPDRLDDARGVRTASEAANHRLLLPTDHRIAREVAQGADSRLSADIPEGWMGVDIGPDTTRAYVEVAREARTIFWNGPMGVFEIEAFAEGTMAIARAVADSAAFSVVGGGDSLAAVQSSGVADRIDHLSTGGGASLEFIQGRTLPGIAALEDAAG